MAERLVSPRPAAARAPAGPLRRRLVDLSVLTVCAFALAGAFLVIADVDRARAPHATPEGSPSPPAAQTAAALPPAPGLAPAPRPTRRAHVVRRSRAS